MHLKGNTPTQIKSELDTVYVKRRAAEIKYGQISLSDNKRSRLSIMAIMTDNIKIIHQMILDDHRIKIKEIAKTVGISKECVFYVLADDLGMRIE